MNHPTISTKPPVRLRHKLKITVSNDIRVRCYLYVPAKVQKTSPVLVSIHGISRNARQHMRRYRKYADEQGVILFMPRFSKRDFSGYQRLCDAGSDLRTDQILLELLERLGQHLDRDIPKIYLTGFSGGAQFAHRFAMLHPERVQSLVLCSAGWYTPFDDDRKFPFGLKTGARFQGIQPNISEFLKIPQCVAVGRWDIYQEPSLKTARWLDRTQGTTRLQRAHWWVKYLQLQAQKRSLPTHIRFHQLDHCGHSFDDAMDVGGLGELVFNFMFANEDHKKTLSSSTPFKYAGLKNYFPMGIEDITTPTPLFKQIKSKNSRRRLAPEHEI